MTDNELITRALTMWINHIQTGDVCMSTKDVVQAGKPGKARMLHSDQQEFVIRLEELRASTLRKDMKFFTNILSLTR